MPHLPHSSSGPYMSISHWTINEEKEILLQWGQEVRRGSSHKCTFQHQYRFPTGRDLPCISSRKWCYFTTTSRRKRDLLLAWQQLSQWETVITQPMKRHYTSSPQFSPMGFLFTTVLPNAPLSSIKDFPLVWTCMWFAIVPLYCNSLLLLNKPVCWYK